MNKALEIAVVLSAVDRMSQVFNSAVNASQAKLKEFQQGYQNSFSTGTKFVAAGLAVAASLAPAVEAYAELEDSSTRLKSVMMADGGILSSNFERVNQIAIDLGNKLPGTTADFQNMFSTLLRSGITEKSIMEGVGKASAYLAVGLKMPYEDAAKAAAKLKEATGTADGEMLAFMDTIARVNQLGVETSEMQYAFSRSAGALKLLNIQGLDASKSIASVYAQLIKTGASGETVGTGMTSIFNSFLNPSKMAAFNKEAAKMGLSFEFVDKKTGQFKGVENMIAQFDRLRGFNPVQRASLVQALLGPGQDAAFMNTLVSQGIEGYNEMQRKMASQATLNTKVDSQLQTIKNIWEASTGTWTNALASFGASFSKELKFIASLLGKIAEWLQKFSEAHPKLMKFVGLFIAISSAVMILVGVFFIAKAAVFAFNAVLLANPIIFIIAAIIAAAVAIYVYWDDIVDFFKTVWDRIKSYFFSAWEWIKGIFVKFNTWFKGWGKYVLLPLLPFIAIPLLIINNWDKISAFFVGIWDSVVGSFKSAWNWISTIAKGFYNIGKTIVTMIWNGIKAMASKPVEAIKDIVQKMRNFLPFSPAKEGPFKDLHKIKIVETIAQSIKPMPMVNAIAGVTRASVSALNAKSPTQMSAATAGGGSVTINYSPQITISGGAKDALDSFDALLRKHKNELLQIFNEEIHRKHRLSY